MEKKLSHKFFLIVIITLITTVPNNIYANQNSDICIPTSNSSILVETPLVKIKKIDDGLKIKSHLYGEINLHKHFPNNKVLIEIIQNEYFLRLFRINQYGLSAFTSKNKKLFKRQSFYKYTRGDHSINMAIILLNYNRPINEIISALLHDYTHTKGSHLGDTLLRNLIQDNKKIDNKIIKEIKELVTQNREDVSAIQDMIFQWYFEKTGMTEILASNSISVENILIKNNPVIKQKSPNLCGDNLEYSLTGAFLANLLDKDDIQKILSSLRVTSEFNWEFIPDEIESAKTLAYASIKLDLINSASAWNAIMNHYGAILFEQAILKKIITIDDLIFAPELNDKQIWEKIKTSNDEKIQNLIIKIKRPNKTYRPVQRKNKGAFFIKAKTRNINPYIMSLGYLSDIDSDFYEYSQKHFQCVTQEGWPVKILDKNFNKKIEIRGF